MFSNCIECDALTSTTSPLLIVLRISGFASSIVSNALPSAPFASSFASSPTVITVGELAKELAKGADGKAFDTIEDAKPEILKTIKSGDVVLVKASHSMQFENIVEFLKQNF